MVIERQRMTVAEFEQWAKQAEAASKNYEFIDGEIVEVVSNPKSSKLGSILNYHIYGFVAEHQLGHVTGADGGYQIGNERYIPDVGFISYERMPELLSEEGYVPAAPDLAVEVLSPNDSNRDIMIKLGNYLAAKTVVWVVDGEKKEIAVYVPAQAVKVYKQDEILDGGKVLAGFRLPLKVVFP